MRRTPDAEEMSYRSAITGLPVRCAGSFQLHNELDHMADEASSDGRYRTWRGKVDGLPWTIITSLPEEREWEKP